MFSESLMSNLEGIHWKGSCTSCHSFLSERKTKGLKTQGDSFCFMYYFNGAVIASVGFPGGSENKESACIVGDLGLIPGLGRCPGEGNGNPLQNSCLENPVDQGAWWVIVHRVTKSRIQLKKYCIYFSNCFHMHLLMCFLYQLMICFYSYNNHITKKENVAQWLEILAQRDTADKWKYVVSTPALSKCPALMFFCSTKLPHSENRSLWDFPISSLTDSYRGHCKYLFNCHSFGLAPTVYECQTFELTWIAPNDLLSHWVCSL